MSQTQTKFFTAQTEYAIPTAAIRISTDLCPADLSGLINKLLKNDSPVSFDFLIGGTLLRSSLQTFLSERGHSAEEGLVIEYMTGVPEPTHTATYTAEDWISRIASTPDGCVTCGFDGVVRYWTAELSESAKVQITTYPLKCIAQMGPNRFVVGGLSRTCTLMEEGMVCEFVGHDASVESVCRLDATTFASASFDGSIGIFGVPATCGETKKRKADQEMPLEQVTAMRKLPGRAPVTAVGSLQANELFSGGHDLSVKRWDIENATVTMSLAVDAPVVSISLSSKLVACALAGPTLKLWDSRSTAVSGNITTEHGALITEIAWRPQSDVYLATSALDGSVRIFDTRNPAGPLHVLVGEATRRFCVAWHGENVLSGGDDCKLDQWKVEV